MPFGSLTDDEQFIQRRIKQLPGGFLDRDTMTFQFSSHSWIIRVDDRTVLVDPCSGNGRRRDMPFFNNLGQPYLERMSAVGVTAESVDIVFCTHLHSDHCGWNVMDVDGAWTPTFPNAEYVFVDTEFRRWDPAAGQPHANDFNESVFDECVRPIVEAGQASIVSAPHSMSPSLSIEAAAGHTRGHTLLRLESEGELAYFTGDALHHPAQISRPELHLQGCDDLSAAIATRRVLLSRVHAEGALIFPAHFAAPHYGAIGCDDGELVFLPGGA